MRKGLANPLVSQTRINLRVLVIMTGSSSEQSKHIYVVNLTFLFETTSRHDIVHRLCQVSRMSLIMVSYVLVTSLNLANEVHENVDRDAQGQQEIFF